MKSNRKKVSKYSNRIHIDNISLKKNVSDSVVNILPSEITADIMTDKFKKINQQKLKKINDLISDGKINEAIALAKNDINNGNPNADIYNALGAIFYNNNNKQEAELNFKIAISMDNKHYLAISNLGKIFFDHEDITSALKCFIKAIKLQPESPVCLRNILNLALKYFPNNFNLLYLEAYEIIFRKKDFIEPSKLKSIKKLAINFIMLNNFFKDICIILKDNIIEFDQFQNKIINFSKIDLFHYIISDNINENLEFEFFLQNLRKKILLYKDKLFFSDELLKITETIALHCHTNDYIIYENSDETNQLIFLEKDINNDLYSKQTFNYSNLLILASYRNLAKYEWKEKIIFPFNFLRLKERIITLPNIEKKHSKNIKVIKLISNEVSKKVRNQYEENPYPRWNHFPKNVNQIELNEYLNASKIKLKFQIFNKKDNINILIAGCGTGQEALYVSSLIKNCNITAIDISSASLSYAIRKSTEYGLNNISFYQCDILDVEKLNQKYDLIISSGVLHHMEKPLDGWKVLKKCLNQNGLMKIALYSKIGRRHLKPFQDKYKDLKIKNLDSTIRKFRKNIITSNNSNLNNLIRFSDFFNLSELRDLIFHVKEHQFTISQIQNILKELEFSFCGFTDTKNIYNTFDDFIRINEDSYNLDIWKKIEEKYKDTFDTMYDFWIQKN